MSVVKRSGVAGLGSQFPTSWERAPFWSTYRRVKRPAKGTEELLSVYRDYGVVRKSDRSDNFNKPSDDLTTYQVVEPGDLVINKMKAWQGSVAVSALSGIVSPAYFVFAPTAGAAPRFMHYMLRSAPYIEAYRAASKGIRPNQWDLDPDVLRTFPVCRPSVTRQNAIADFLDREAAEIDAFIADQEELIRLLTERRAATISHAVTKGLDPTVPMKDSGIAAIGRVPEGWTVWPFTRLAAHRVDYRGATPQKVDNGILLVTARNVRQGFIDYEASREYVAAEFYDQVMRRGLPELGDLLLTMEAPLGNVALIDRTDIALAQRVIKFRVDPSVNSRFVLYSMMADSFQQQIQSRATGSTALGLKASKLPELRIALPPRAAQDRIVELLDEILSEVGAAVEDAREAIALSRERRAALISAAVTGKIDVRESAAFQNRHNRSKSDTFESAS